ncbi:Ig-like domain-containing protein [Priestia koreensis]|uniref:Ig-like domain-containing protein n=1 Tax=Priestia koreensis TaxID=284581 RepID=UPI001F57BD92|nr:Ig-like domain-containing protein [Priestia koreensis]UNL84831.1 Ig-like domain-containing protein [Priestia koreensis]
MNRLSKQRKKIVMASILALLYSSYIPQDKEIHADDIPQNVSVSNDLNWLKPSLQVNKSVMTVDLSNHFPLNGNEIEYKAVSSNNNSVEVTTSTNYLILNIKSKGKSTIVVSAKDENSQSIEDTIEVSVDPKGDADGDGILTSADILIVNQIISGKKIVTEEEKKKYDIDGDGVITRNDAIKIKDIYLAGPNYTPTFDSYFITLNDVNDVPIASQLGINGELIVGRTLTGTYTYQDIEGDREDQSLYKWYRSTKADGSDKKEIEGANQLTYTLSAEDQESYIFFEIVPVASTGNVLGNADMSTTKNKVKANEAPTATNVTIHGTTKVGNTLTGQYVYSDSENDNEANSTFKWYRATQADGSDKIEIVGAIKSSYTVSSEDEGYYIFFEVTPLATTGSVQGNPSMSNATEKTKANEAPTAINVTIHGTTKVGDTLTGQYIYSDPENDNEANSTFKWYRATQADGSDKAEIVGATQSTYTLTSKDKDYYIFFEVVPVASTGTTHGWAVMASSTDTVTENIPALSVTSLSPVNFSTSISNTADFTITFDKNVSPTTKKIRIISERTGTSEYAANDSRYIKVQGNTVTITNPGLLHNEKVYIEIEEGAFKSEDGAEFDGIIGDSTWSFTTVNPSPSPYFSEYLNGGDGRIAVEIYAPVFGNTEDKMTGYTLEVYKWSLAKNVMESSEVKQMLPWYKGMTYIFINNIFYDYFDLTNASYYNDEINGYNNLICGFVLKDASGKVVDTLGSTTNRFPDQQTKSIFENGGTITRKSGIHAGSSNYSLKEWNVFSKGTYQYMGTHTP